MTRERPRIAEPKGKAKTLRQKDRIRTGLRKVHAKEDAHQRGNRLGAGRESLRFRRRQKDKRCLSVYFSAQNREFGVCGISKPLPSSGSRGTPDDTSPDGGGKALPFRVFRKLNSENFCQRKTQIFYRTSIGLRPLPLEEGEAKSKLPASPQNSNLKTQN